jgi:hypothetical protein
MIRAGRVAHALADSSCDVLCARGYQPEWKACFGDRRNQHARRACYPGELIAV